MGRTAGSRWWSDGGIVTPEGVILDFDRAGVASRMVARIIDLGVQLALIVFVGNVLVISLVAYPAAGLVAILVVLFAAIFVYPVVLEVFWRGRTVGKYAVGLRVVTVEGASIRLRHAAVRSILQLVDIYATLGGAAVVAALTSAEGQRLGDMAAGTYVVRDRRSRSTLAEREVVIPPPWGHENTVAALDPRGLDIGQAALLRSFLVRVTEFEPVSRAMLADQLAQRVSDQIASPVPASIHPETWLACVAAAVQQRALASSPPVSSLPPPSSPGGRAPPETPSDTGWARPS